jgi:hypothetical protein
MKRKLEENEELVGAKKRKLFNCLKEVNDNRELSPVDR